MRKELEWMVCPRCKGSGARKIWEISLSCYLCDGNGKILIKEIIID